MAFLGRHRWAAAILGAMAACQAAEVLRYELGNPVAPASGTSARLKVLMANVLASNRDHDALFDLVSRERPDVVALVEFNHAWQQQTELLRQSYPYSIELPNGTRGLALYSSVPILEASPPSVVRPFGDGNPALAVTLEFEGEPMHLWILHPPSPLGGDGRARGRAEFLELAEQIARRTGRTLVVGDMNRTDGSPTFADFLDRTGLRDTRLGFGHQPSWPVGSPYRIPIDHAFVGPGLAVVDRRLGPEIGSDHLPLLVELAPALLESARETSTTQRSESSGSP
jgi:endonuclease/exonuclease/phosphatase (EEP) superfamily protein YafD